MQAPSMLGGRLRRLLDALDGEVEKAYRRNGLDFRPRFTPVLKALFDRGPMRVRDLAEATGLSQSALSQTLTQMETAGWVAFEPGRDRRERYVHATRQAQAAAPLLERQWRATAKAAASLDAELGLELEPVVGAALEALARQSFGDRIREAEEASE